VKADRWATSKKNAFDIGCAPSASHGGGRGAAGEAYGLELSEYAFKKGALDQSGTQVFQGTLLNKKKKKNPFPGVQSSDVINL